MGPCTTYTVAGTEETPNYMTDIVTLSQGDRGIIEFKYDYPGEYMFHAHQVEFTDKGWMGLFDVKSNTTANKGQIQAAIRDGRHGVIASKQLVDELELNVGIL